LKLEENDIYCFIKNDNIAQLQIGWANFELMVNESDKEMALQILNEKS
jgi:DNA relaxase NicK